MNGDEKRQGEGLDCYQREAALKRRSLRRRTRKVAAVPRYHTSPREHPVVVCASILCGREIQLMCSECKNGILHVEDSQEYLLCDRCQSCIEGVICVCGEEVRAPYVERQQRLTKWLMRLNGRGELEAAVMTAAVLIILLCLIGAA